YLDAVLLGAFVSPRLTFAINTRIARKPLLRPFLTLAKIFPMDPTNPLSMKSLVRHVSEGRETVIFPEGRITLTGSLMKIYDGPGLVADKSGAAVVPVRIDGAQYTPFSRLRGRVRLRWFPKITLTVLPPATISPPAHVTGRERRRAAGRMLADLMTEMVFATSNYRRTLFTALLDARRVHGGRRPVIEDTDRRPLSYNRLVTAAFALGDALSMRTRPGERVGVVLPGMIGTVATLLGLQAHARVPAMLNYTLDAKDVRSACRAADIKTLVTSRRFVHTARLDDTVGELATTCRVLYLEDLQADLRLGARLRAWLSGRLARWAYRRRCPHRDPDDPAVVLFTTGARGGPRGVVLSHANLLASRAQLAARIDFSARDVALNTLPLFHSFGLTAGTLLPLLAGMRTFLYPSPLHYRIVPEIAYAINATILFGTSSFLAGYARHAHPYDFYSVRYVFAGAEELHEDVRRTWSERFGVRIFGGYGATETGPVLATNTPMENRPNTVGRFLPGLRWHLEPVAGVTQGGRLHVQGPNVMLGYLRADAPDRLVPTRSSQGPGWFDTGDIATIDDEGYVRIRDRARRFAKVGGERS
ncbi:MAG: AMP-binding protein, partial [Gammaproteobacteria bacterium]|nr:AMP-binding protein [Gammaproteobacteria bacterium]NIR99052.1 AMP-binding protein [Gammaproteobacteria bacterium]NIT64675.1 AMP-binding protein [Gammaproteobacteria bacterium]NIY33255.1 AMP-binding protein [Gammaproteobacteria bacterium]